MAESSYYCYGFELIPFPDYELIGGGLLLGRGLLLGCD